MLSLYNYDNNISDLEKGNETCITSNSIYYGPYIRCFNLYSEKITNAYFYFVANGDTSLFDFLVSGEYLKLCKDGRYNEHGNFYSSFVEDYTISSSSLNSLTNSSIIPYQSVVINYGDGDFDSNPSLIDGEIGIYQFGYYPYYYYTQMILRYDIRIPKTVVRPSVSGTIDFVLVYTYTT